MQPKLTRGDLALAALAYADRLTAMTLDEFWIEFDHRVWAFVDNLWHYRKGRISDRFFDVKIEARRRGVWDEADTRIKAAYARKKAQDGDGGNKGNR